MAEITKDSLSKRFWKSYEEEFSELCDELIEITKTPTMERLYRSIVRLREEELDTPTERGAFASVMLSSSNASNIIYAYKKRCDLWPIVNYLNDLLIAVRYEKTASFIILRERGRIIEASLSLKSKLDAPMDWTSTKTAPGLGLLTMFPESAWKQDRGSQRKTPVDKSDNLEAEIIYLDETKGLEILNKILDIIKSPTSYVDSDLVVKGTKTKTFSMESFERLSSEISKDNKKIFKIS